MSDTASAVCQHARVKSLFLMWDGLILRKVVLLKCFSSFQRFCLLLLELGRNISFTHKTRLPILFVSLHFLPITF